MVGNMHMISPKFPDGPPDMLIAGNDAEAKKMEYFRTGSPNHAFKMLRK